MRAQELRQESVQTSWPDVRKRVLALAEQYDLLADSLERSGATGASRDQKCRTFTPAQPDTPVASDLRDFLSGAYMAPSK